MANQNKAPQDIIIRPIVTEQSIAGLDENKYTFEVAKDANKLEIRKAVEVLFDVKVSKVNTLNVKGRTRRVGKHTGKRPDWKKAVVTLAAGESSIEFFDSLH